MSDIDPQEFGRLQAQVETLIASDREKTELLKTLSDNVTAMRLEMTETMAQAMGGQPGTVQMELNVTDFSTAQRVVDAVNRRFGYSTAQVTLPMPRLTCCPSNTWIHLRPQNLLTFLLWIQPNLWKVKFKN